MILTFVRVPFIRPSYYLLDYIWALLESAPTLIPLLLSTGGCWCESSRRVETRGVEGGSDHLRLLLTANNHNPKCFPFAS